MKVLMVSKSQVVSAYHGKLREIARLGVDLTVVVPPRWGPDELEITHSNEYKIEVLPANLLGYPHFYFYRRYPRDLKADLVHLEEEPWSLVTYQFMRRFKKTRTPTIFFSWQNIKKTFPPPFSWIERFNFANAVGAIAGTAEAATVIGKKGFSKPLAVIPQLGVDPTIFSKQDTRELRERLKINDRFVIGFLGRIREEKGISDLIYALYELPPKFVLVLVGDGNFRQKAKQLVADLGLWVGSSRVDLQACKLEYSIVSPK